MKRWRRRPQTDELRDAQLVREQEERDRARSSPIEPETAQHERRAEKARYLRQKLDERAESERGDQADSDGGEP